MHRAQHGIAVGDVLHQHADSNQVVYLFEVSVLNHHLAVDAVQVLGSALNLKVLDAHLVQLVAQGGDDGLYLLLALNALDAHLVGHLAIPLRVDVAQGQVFNLLLDGVYAQAVSDGRVDVQRLMRDGHLALGRLKAQRAHVMQAVGQLDQHHADIPPHGQYHFAQGLGLLLLTVGEVEAAQLGHAVHQLHDFAAELLLDDVQGDVVVILHRVVQQARCHGGAIQHDFHQNARHILRVNKVWLAALAQLPVMGLLREVERLFDHSEALPRIVLLHPADHFLQGQAFKLAVGHRFSLLQ